MCPQAPADNEARRSLAFPRVLLIDLPIVALTVGLAVWGFFRGFAVGALALLGFGGGAVIGSRVAPLALEDGLHSTYAPTVALPAALLLGAALAALFEWLGISVRRRLGRRLGRADEIGGAVLAGCVGLIAAWLLGAVVAQVHSLREPIVHSAILKRLNAVLPPPGPVLVADVPPVRSLPTYEGPAPRVGRPDPRIVSDPDIRIAARSVARIGSQGCHGGVLGSGWVAARGVIATNAHVVAGQDVITVSLHGNRRQAYDALPIWFDRRNDLALLRVPDLRRATPLPLAFMPRSGTPGGLLGFPGGRWDMRPARLGPTTTRLAGSVADSPELPGRRLFGILITPFLGLSRPGNSGGPIVDTRGRVIATVFAGNGVSGAAVANATVREALHRAGPKVSTGPCEEG